MNKFFGVILFLTVNLMIVSSFRTLPAIKKPGDLLDHVAPPPIPTVNFTVPGTKWCGIGNVPNDYYDLGTFNGTDLCCRAHQQCEEIIDPISSLHELANPTLLPRYKCDCEEQLLICLKEQKDIPSSIFGEAYFSLMEKCFVKDYPAVKCVKHQVAMGIKRCVMYEFDETKEKVYQFLDLPFFTDKP